MENTLRSSGMISYLRVVPGRYLKYIHTVGATLPVISVTWLYLEYSFLVCCRP